MQSLSDCSFRVWVCPQVNRLHLSILTPYCWFTFRLQISRIRKWCRWKIWSTRETLFRETLFGRLSTCRSCYLPGFGTKSDIELFRYAQFLSPLWTVMSLLNQVVLRGECILRASWWKCKTNVCHWFDSYCFVFASCPGPYRMLGILTRTCMYLVPTMSRIHVQIWCMTDQIRRQLLSHLISQFSFSYFVYPDWGWYYILYNHFDLLHKSHVLCVFVSHMILELWCKYMQYSFS